MRAAARRPCWTRWAACCSMSAKQSPRSAASQRHCDAASQAALHPRLPCLRPSGQRKHILALAYGGDIGWQVKLRPQTLSNCLVVVRTVDVSLQGVVVFFPSFAYADQVHEHWQATGALERLGHRKRVFREPRSAVEVESVLR